jgi:hypothetical protein
MVDNAAVKTVLRVLRIPELQKSVPRGKYHLHLQPLRSLVPGVRSTNTQEW